VTKTRSSNPGLLDKWGNGHEFWDVDVMCVVDGMTLVSVLICSFFKNEIQRTTTKLEVKEVRSFSESIVWSFFETNRCVVYDTFRTTGPCRKRTLSEGSEDLWNDQVTEKSLALHSLVHIYWPRWPRLSETSSFSLFLSRLSLSSLSTASHNQNPNLTVGSLNP